MLLEFGHGKVLVACYSTNGPSGVIDGVAFRPSETAHEVGESDPSVDGKTMMEFGPCLRLHFANADSVQVLIEELEIVRGSLRANTTPQPDP